MVSEVPGPLRLQPIFLPKVWAAQAFPQPFQEIFNAPAKTGEVWLASDRHHVTPVAAGKLTGTGLDQVLAYWQEYILGPGKQGGFPLLLKLLNVGQWLSVQVHPDDQHARRMENEPWGKHEAWHFLQAGPEAAIILGWKPGTKLEDIRPALERGELSQLLARVPVKGGDTFGVPANTVHALGPDMFLCEVQQASDVTYRLYDWDRPGDDGKPRELHLDKALEVVSLQGPGAANSPTPLSPPPQEASLLIQTPYFSLLRYGLAPQAGRAVEPGVMSLLLVLSGGGDLYFPGQEHPSEALTPGDCWLLPAGLAPAGLRAHDGGMEFLAAKAPES